MTRRDFLAVAAVTAVGPGFSRAEPSTNATIRLHISGAAGRAGAQLAVAEMSRTASLLGRRLDATGIVGAAIDLTAGSVESAGAVYYVCADDPMRASALTTWRRDHKDAALRAVEWHASLDRFGAEQLNERYRRAAHQPMDGAAWVAWMLVKATVESELRGVPLSDGRFDGHKGVALTFDAHRRLRQPLCIVDDMNALLGVV